MHHAGYPTLKDGYSPFARCLMKQKIVTTFFAIAVFGAVNSPTVASAAGGVAKGEASDEKGQQGLGLQQEGQSSNVIKGDRTLLKAK